MNSPDERVFGPPRDPVPTPGKGPIRLVYHGGTSERFGVSTLIEAVRLLDDPPGVSLDVYGAAIDPALADQAAEVPGRRVHLAAAPTPFEQIPEKLAQAHIGVVPTLRNDFTELLLPVKLLECIHMGLPVVCARLPVIEQHFSERELWYFEPGSPEALGAAVRSLLAAPDEAAKRASRASRRLADFAWRGQQERYLALVDDLSRRNGRNGAGR